MDCGFCGAKGKYPYCDKACESADVLRHPVVKRGGWPLVGDKRPIRRLGDRHYPMPLTFLVDD